MAKKKRSGIIVFLVIVVILAGLVLLSLFGLKGDTKKSGPGKKPFGQDYVAVVGVSGVIQSANKSYNQQWLLDIIDDLKDDKKNLGLLLTIDSPGGSVYEADEVYLALKEYGKNKPVQAFLGPMAASGGYYVACGAGKITANRNTLTGSIGVISSQSVDLSRLLEKNGVTVTTITAGKNKNMLNYNSPLTDEQRGIMQSIADECYDQFVGIVAEARHMGKDQVRLLADGRIFTAKQAKEAALIDDIAPFRDTLENFRAALLSKSEKGNLETVYFDYSPKSTFADWFIKIPGLGKGLKEAVIQEVIEDLLVDVSYPAFIYQGQ
jgi:protease-4